MISYQQALAILTKQERRTSKKLAIQQSCGAICAEAIHSPSPLPYFRTSAMDGFALDQRHILKAAKTNPICLPIAASIKTGANIKREPTTQENIAQNSSTPRTYEIMTGANLPEHCNAVVKIENVRVKNNLACFSKPVPINHHIRLIGADFQTGDLIMHAGQTINPFHIMILATLGIEKIAITPLPKVSILSTGRELVDDPTAQLQQGQIRNASAPYLLTALKQMGLQPSYAGLITDDPDLFISIMQTLCSQTDMIISTGAVSVGRFDFIPETLQRLGAEILFHKVKVRPGAPTLYARFQNGTHYFGLPGNPVSSIIGLRFFIQPFLRHLIQAPPETYPTAILADDIHKACDFRLFQKALLDHDGRVKILSDQESFKLKPLLKANCWAILPAGQATLQAGQQIAIAPY